MNSLGLDWSDHIEEIVAYLQDVSATPVLLVYITVLFIVIVHMLSHWQGLLFAFFHAAYIVPSHIMTASPCKGGLKDSSRMITPNF